MMTDFGCCVCHRTELTGPHSYRLVDAANATFL